MSVVSWGCETWTLALREKQNFGKFENRKLRKKFRPKKPKVTENGEDYIMRSSVICVGHQALLGRVGRGMWRAVF
jgi:hypothetical protein